MVVVVVVVVLLLLLLLALAVVLAVLVLVTGPPSLPTSPRPCSRPTDPRRQIGRPTPAGGPTMPP